MRAWQTLAGYMTHQHAELTARKEISILTKIDTFVGNVRANSRHRTMASSSCCNDRFCAGLISSGRFGFCAIPSVLDNLTESVVNNRQQIGVQYRGVDLHHARPHECLPSPTL